MRNHPNKLNTGFTIVETLVAIAILMISIAGPLTIAQKGLMASIYARDQSVATFLAQDAMEYVKNYRDSLILSGHASSWIEFSSTVCNVPCKVTTTGIGSISTGGPYVLYRTANGFSHENLSGEAESQFSREVSIFEMDEEGQVQVIVKVEWTNGKIQNVVTIEGYLFEIQL